MPSEIGGHYKDEAKAPMPLSCPLCHKACRRMQN